MQDLYQQRIGYNGSFYLPQSNESTWSLWHHPRHGCNLCSVPHTSAATATAGFTKVHALVCTVGALTVWPGASNVIAGAANFTVDIRCRADDVRLAVVRDTVASINSLCAR